jgi:plasmid stabilization system protein ParE
MAAKPVRFHEQADTEYDDALDWYLARSPQAAAEFAEELTRPSSSFQAHPIVGHAIALVLADFSSIVFRLL